MSERAITIPCPECQPIAGVWATLHRPPITVCIRCGRPVMLRELTFTGGVGVPAAMTADPPLTCGHHPEDLRPATLPCRCGGSGKVTVMVSLLETDEVVP